MWRPDLPSSRNPLRFFLYASKPHWRVALFASFFAAVACVFSATVPYVFKLAANAAAGLPADEAFRDLLWAGGGTILFLAFAKLFWRISGFAGAAWSMNSLATARYSLTAYITLHSRAYFSDRFAGSLANKISHAARGMREGVELFLWEFLELAVTAVTSLIILFLTNPRLAWIFLVWIFVVIVLNVHFARKRVPYASRAQKLETALNGGTVDLLSNVGAMQEFARRAYEIERLKMATDERRKAGLRNWYFGEWIRIMNSVILVFFGGLMAFMVVYFARAGLVSLGDVVMVLAIILRIEGLLQSLGSNINRFAEVWGEIQESLEEIIEPHEIPDKPGAKELAVPHGEIALRGVTFSYAGNMIFQDLSLTIRGGERVGLVGRSGAGKSTLMRLILHHHDIDSGAILVDGSNIAQVTQESLRRAIAVVPQEPLLFHRTITENIAYGNPSAAEADIEQAAKLAHAHDFILTLEKGYASLVGERGVKLSGGERQRVAIARAILKRAPVLLLDEATSALDSESEVEIQKALSELMRGKTVIAIAHRLSTLREMDRIIVLDDGRIVEEGSHEELLSKKGTYAELWAHQAGGFMTEAA